MDGQTRKGKNVENICKYHIITLLMFYSIQKYAHKDFLETVCRRFWIFAARFCVTKIQNNGRNSKKIPN